jgi:hypothetical protein
LGFADCNFERKISGYIKMQCPLKTISTATYNDTTNILPRTTGRKLVQTRILLSVVKIKTVPCIWLPIPNWCTPLAVCMNISKDGILRRLLTLLKKSKAAENVEISKA